MAELAHRPADPLVGCPAEHAGERRRDPHDEVVASAHDDVGGVLGEEPVLLLRRGEREGGLTALGDVAPAEVDGIADPDAADVEAVVAVGARPGEGEVVEHGRLARLDGAQVLLVGLTQALVGEQGEEGVSDGVVGERSDVGEGGRVGVR